jgi:Putative transposase
LPVCYFHLVFSVPHSLAPLIWQNKKLLFSVLFETSAATLLEVAADPGHLGAQIGFLSILHTWGQTLQRHPHVHCVVPGGGLSLDHSRWIRSPPHFFLPVRVLSRVFRGKFVAGLRQAFHGEQLAFHGELRSLANEKAFAAFLRTLFREDWVVYAKAPFGGPEHVLQYLARYTHRVAISNHRLLSVDADHVTFRWKDYAHHSNMSCPRASHAFATSAGWPTAGVVSYCRFAEGCSRPHLRLPLAPPVKTLSGSARPAVAQCVSWSG